MLITCTQVPRVDRFSEQAQLHGAIILELKRKWPCAQHKGENGDSGFCYISPNGEHLGLNSRKLKFWAASIVSSQLYTTPTHLTTISQAAADSTKHKPPNTVEFDGVRDGRLIAPKPRGRSGPRAQATGSAPNNDATALLMAAMIPLLSNLSQKRPRSVSPHRSSSASAPTKPRDARVMPFPLSPIPGTGSELRACLSDFAGASGIDITECEEPLMDLELTPDIIPDIPVARLLEVTGTVEGRIRKFQAYCRIWNTRLDAKKVQLANKRRRVDEH